jgi:glycosyltransferase involved in cell wall biosynthesis
MSGGGVLHLTLDLPPRDGGGISTAVGGLVAASRAAGVPTRVVSFDGHWRRIRGQTAQKDVGGGVYRVTAKGDLADASAFAAATPVQRVVCHHAMLWPLAAELAAAAGARSVYVAHVLLAEQDRLRGLSEPTRSATREAEATAAADVVIAPSPWAAETLRRAAATQRPPVVCPPGVDPPPLAERRGPDGPAPARRVVVPGRFDALKGSDRVVEMLGPLLAADPAVELLIVGGLRDNTRAEARWRERFVDAAGAHAGRLKITGWLPRPQALGAIASARVAALPSRVETFGLAALEAGSLGLPVVVAEGPARGLAGAWPDAWRPMHVVDPPDTPTTWVRALRRALDAAPAPHALAAGRVDLSWASRWPVWAPWVC